MLLESIKQASNVFGLNKFTVCAGRRNGAPERRAKQRMVINNNDFVVHLQAPVRRS
jgi:hypothetical protein